jgi:hypothetical protein
MATVEQNCLAGCEMDCFYFGCLKKDEGCDKYKRLRAGERYNAKGELIEKADEKRLNGG